MGLIDTSKTERLEHPNEKGQWVDIRPLLATEMDEARDKRIKHILDMWGDTIKGATAGKATQQDDIASRVQQYDSETLLNAAIKAWSYEGEINSANIARLDGSTRDWLVEEVVKSNTRPLAK